MLGLHLVNYASYTNYPQQKFEILLVLDIPERTLLSEGATEDIDSRCTRVDVTDGAGREDMAMRKCVDSEGLRVDLTTFG